MTGKTEFSSTGTSVNETYWGHPAGERKTEMKSFEEKAAVIAGGAHGIGKANDKSDFDGGNYVKGL